jgi:5-methylcytosine-specific restriction enzyme subunit McrC
VTTAVKNTNGTCGKATAEDSVVIRNIYYMMAYAFKALDVEGFARLKTEDFDNMADLMAAILAIGISLQLKRGIEKEYLETGDHLHSIKGRVDMRDTARLSMQQRAEVSCRFDEFGPDTYKNRILKTCAMILVRHPDVNPLRRRDLKRCLILMQDVGELDPRRVEWGRLRYHRNNSGYQILMNVCYMVLSSLILTTDQGSVKLASFSDSQRLHALYEKFVLEYFRREHRELKASAKVIDRGVGDDAPSFLPQLCTDITLERPGRTLIIDTKCYGHILSMHYEHEIMNRDNLNQIQSYVMHETYTNQDVEVSGMLLYALTEHDAAHHDSWDELGHRFHLWTLDLSQPFFSIAHDLDEIARLIGETVKK